MRKNDSGHRLGLAQIHLAVLLAGGAGLFAKFLALDPAVLTAGRTLFGSLALLLFARITRGRLRLASPGDLGLVALSGAILAAHWFTFFHAIQISTVAIGLLAFSAFPLFTTFLEPAVFGEPLRGRDLAVALAVTGGLALVTPRFDLGDHLTRGLLWGLLSAFAYAVLALLNRACVRRNPAVGVAFHQQACAALCSLPFALAARGTAIPARDLALLAVLGVVFTALAHALVVASLRHLRAQTTSIVFALEPVYGIALARVLLGEIPAGRTLAGVALICGAVLSASLRRGERNKKRLEGMNI